MNNILILYPKEFMCYSKFERKISNIVSKLDEYCLLYFEDHNGYIEKFSSESNKKLSVELIEKGNYRYVSHAIVFDDGEEFVREIGELNKYDLKIRVIKINITRVVNIKRDHQYEGIKSTPEYEYIGRGSYWGNPYAIGENGDDRNEVIRKFKYDFDCDMFPNKKKTEVIKLSGKRLGCFCKPHSCHGDILADYLNSYDDGK